ncbi:MAG: hypothetical protein IGR76_16800 [Synechococcales cyanobacterium T60_A2020_003]|nr:hypothetical protein [Synechococcales cyanobacterium T60_A2020_003]
MAVFFSSTSQIFVSLVTFLIFVSKTTIQIFQFKIKERRSNLIFSGGRYMFRKNLNRKKTAQMHRENLRKNLEQRMEAARAQGNDALVRQLEAEARYLQ